MDRGGVAAALVTVLALLAAPTPAPAAAKHGSGHGALAAPAWMRPPYRRYTLLYYLRESSSGTASVFHTDWPPNGTPAAARCGVESVAEGGSGLSHNRIDQNQESVHTRFKASWQFLFGTYQGHLASIFKRASLVHHGQETLSDQQVPLPGCPPVEPNEWQAMYESCGAPSAYIGWPTLEVEIANPLTMNVRGIMADYGKVKDCGTKFFNWWDNWVYLPAGTSDPRVAKIVIRPGPIRRHREVRGTVRLDDVHEFESPGFRDGHGAELNYEQAEEEWTVDRHLSYGLTLRPG